MDCPFLNSGQAPCSKYLNMQRIEFAFQCCTDMYMFCPVYLHMALAKDNPVQCETNQEEYPAALAAG